MISWTASASGEDHVLKHLTVHLPMATLPERIQTSLAEIASRAAGLAWMATRHLD